MRLAGSILRFADVFVMLRRPGASLCANVAFARYCYPRRMGVKLAFGFEAMLMQKRNRLRLSLSLLVAALFACFPLAAQQAPDAGGTDNEIRIGNIMPYTGPLAAFATIGRAEAAYFDMVNERGGINGRKIKFVSLDDSSSPKTAIEQTQSGREAERAVHVRRVRHAEQSRDTGLSQ